jgi:uncharacterized protein (DUF488 family)
VLTIGHSNHPIERFVELLRTHGVTAVADVRSQPFSRYNLAFNRQVLAASLREHGIAYAFLGQELGARSDIPGCYEDGRVQFRRLAETELFKSGIRRVLRGAKAHHLALVCAEKEPLACHRTFLVARALVDAGVAVAHIHADGHLESQPDAMARLPQLLGMPEADLFRSKEQVIAEAIAMQEQRIAYLNDDLRPEADRE